MKKFWGLIFVLLLFGLIAKACIRADIPYELPQRIPEPNLSGIVYPEANKNVTIDGIDYLESRAPLGKFGGELVVSIIGEGPKTFNPCNTKDATSSSLAGLLYDGLVTTNPLSGEVEPLLAKDFEILGCDYTINLRHGIKWSDGQPITADDVMYTYEEIVFKGLGNPSTMDAMTVDGKIPELVKIDDYTVKFTTPREFAPFLRQLSYPIVPKHYFKPYSDKGSSVFNAFLSPNTNPKEIVSSGAFMLKEYAAAQRAVFVKNPDYYKINTANQKLPYLDKVIYVIVGDTNNEILKFEAGEIDVLGLRGSNVARCRLKEPYSDYKIYNLGADTGTLFLVINLSRGRDKNGKPYVNPIKQEWFGSKDFRSAIDWAVDRKSMVQNIASGTAEPLFTPESLNSIYLNKNIQGHPRDLKIAEEYLENAGFTKKDEILYDPKGRRVEFDLYTNAGNLERESIGVTIKQDLENLGMKVNFKPVEFNSLVNKLTNTLDWDTAIMGLTGSPLEPHDGKNVWTSSGSLHMFNMRAVNSKNTKKDDRLDWEKELDEIFEDGALKLSFEERKPIYDRYQEIIYTQKPIIYLYSPIRISAVRKKFKNVFPTSLSGLIHNLDEIYIDEDGGK